MCTRCVRFTREITQTGELQVMRRGNHAEIDIFPGHPVDNPLAGNVVDLCPVGALLDKDFLHKQRVWFLSKHDSICTRCSTGCNISAEENRGPALAVQAAVQPARQRLLDLRRGPVQLQGGQRPGPALGDVRPRGRRPPAVRRSTRRSTAVGRGLARGRPSRGGRSPGVLSPFLTVEEAYLMASYLKGLSPATVLALGPVPVAGRGPDRSRPTRPRAGPATPASSSPGRSRSTPRSARTAGASRRSSSTSRAR